LPPKPLIRDFSLASVKSIAIYTGTGGSTVHLDAAPATTVIHCNGTDTIAVGDGDLSAINAPVVVAGNSAGTTQVFVDDRADPSSQSFTFTNRAVIRGTPALGGRQLVVTNGGISSLTFQAGSGSDTFTVQGSIAPTTLDTGYGNDSVSVVGGNVPLT